MPVMLNVVAPTLVNVVDKVMELPTLWRPKFRLLGLSSTTVPVPLRLTVCGLPAASSVIDRCPGRLPGSVGLKVTLIVQLARTASVEPQLSDWLKSRSWTCP
jgi:hypothetical protein